MSNIFVVASHVNNFSLYNLIASICIVKSPSEFIVLKSKDTVSNYNNSNMIVKHVFSKLTFKKVLIIAPIIIVSL